MKSVRRPVLVAQNDVPDLNMSRMSHACRTKWTYLKKRARPGTLVKRDLRKTGRSLCASLRSRNAHGHDKGTFMRESTREKAGDQMEHLLI